MGVRGSQRASVHLWVLGYVAYVACLSHTELTTFILPTSPANVPCQDPQEGATEASVFPLEDQV